jgi:microsomal dipeptidase-like Zn-dependent dipeptidase
MRRIIIALVVLLVVAAAALFAFGPGAVDRSLNTVLADQRPRGELSAQARQLHDFLFVADLHADPLLWDRDLLVEADHGHVDIPRLIAGGVALQVFGAPTQVPAGINYEANDLGLDVVTALAITQRWPARTWQSPLQRALYMAEVLQRTADAAPDRFRVLRSAAELNRFAGERATKPERVAGLLAIEGMHALEGDLDNIDVLFAAGYRMMGLTHFFDNEIGGSAHGLSKEGLTDLGRQAVARMQERGIVVDLAHASPKMFDDVIAMTTKPVVVSHGGVKGTCDNVRNLSDDQLRAVAATGGVVGIGYWDAAICDVSMNGVVKAIRHAISVAGVDHVGLGSDFDGATTTPFDTSDLPHLTQALLDAGVPVAQIRKVMGDNVRRVLREALPPGAG